MSRSVEPSSFCRISTTWALFLAARRAGAFARSVRSICPNAAAVASEAMTSAIGPLFPANREVRLRRLFVQLLAGLPEVLLELVDLSAQPLHFALDRALVLFAVAKLGELLFAFPGQAARFRAEPGREMGRIVDDSMPGRAQPALGLLRLLLRIPGGSFEIPLGSLGFDTQVFGRVSYLVGDVAPGLSRRRGDFLSLLLGGLRRLLRLLLCVRDDILDPRRDGFGPRRDGLILPAAGQRDQERRDRGAAD